MSTDPARSREVRARRGTVSFFLVVCLAVEIGAPLSYYLGRRSDERFAWRMFSSTAARDCRAVLHEVVDDGGAAARRPVDPLTLVSTGWVELLKRRDPRVTQAVLDRLCVRSGAREVRLLAGCGNETTVDVVRRACPDSRNQS